MLIIKYLKKGKAQVNKVKMTRIINAQMIKDKYDMKCKMLKANGT